ncbi:DUF6048 family protein [Reichenbachiella versicolor]|uniref:DUF6048 family protein n=1 Tax=Reichenbachiella versicolor TaxID=1821036 RepID=UPI0013A53572|nr:DUF6048 family protein [Reichenbachiella versicolor]
MSSRAQESLDSLTTQTADSLAVSTLEKEVEEPKEIMPFFSSASFIYDYGKLAGLFLKTEMKQEVGAQIEFWNRLVLVGEFGTAKLEPNGAYQNANYISEGWYYRAGIGYKYDMNPKNNFALTLRYGQSFYGDKGRVEIFSKSGIHDDYVEPFNRENNTAYWYEVVLSSEKKIWKGLYTGFHMRLRVMGYYEQQQPLDVYSIPGYGRTFDNTIPAINLYLKYAFEMF